MSIKMLKIFFYKTDFEGCYIANELFKILLFSNFDKCIETSKRIAEDSSFLSFIKICFLLTKSKFFDTIKINQRSKGVL